MIQKSENSGISTLTLKIIACAAMLLDHAGYVIQTWQRIDHDLYDVGYVFRYPGRIAFPIFAFMIAFGFTHTRNKWLYALRLNLFGIPAQFAYNYFSNRDPLIFDNGSVYCTLFLGLISIIFFDMMRRSEKKPVRLLCWLPVAECALIAYFVPMDYGILGVLFVFVCYLCLNRKWLLIPAFALFSVRNVIIYYICKWFSWTPPSVAAGLKWDLVQICAFAAIVPVLLVNENKRPKLSPRAKSTVQYGFYLFYPAHLTLLAVISYFVLNYGVA